MNAPSLPGNDAVEDRVEAFIEETAADKSLHVMVNGNKAFDTNEQLYFYNSESAAAAGGFVVGQSTWLTAGWAPARDRRL